MASQKEEPNTSFLFGDSTGDDPFSQIQQQNTIPEAKKEEMKPTANEQKQPQQTSNVVGDASSLFGGASNDNADLFFSSAPAQQQQQQSHQPLTSNASAAAFFEQPTQSDSFFDGLGQGTQPAAAASLTQAYDPNAYASYDYSNQTNQQQQAENQQPQEYDQSQWIQFDPNQHYYYDEQGQVHYYDPNTNQEYDMSQYGYDQQGQTYDYQYDPQYAEYYAQQGYDTSAYTTGDSQQQEQQQQQYNATAYEQQTQQQQQAADGSYYDYNSQAYTPVTNAVAEVPAQIQSEQTIDTQHYTPQQGEEYGVQQNYTPADASIEPQQQQQEFNYQGYDNTDVQQYTMENTFAPEDVKPVNALDAQFVTDNTYAPSNQDFTQMQNEFMAEDLQQAPPSTANILPPPPMAAVAPPKKVFSPPPMNSAPPQKVLSPPPQNTSIAPPPKSVQATSQEIVPPSVTSSHRGSFDANVPAKEIEEEVNLDDLDDLVLGGSVKSGNQPASDEFDLLMSTADYDGFSKQSEKEPVYTNPNAYDEISPEQVVPTQVEPPKTMETAVVEKEIDQPAETKELEKSADNPIVESEQSEKDVDHKLNEPQQDERAADTLNQSEQAVDYSFSQQDGQAVDFSSYEPHQNEEAIPHHSYEPKQDEQAVSYNAYEPEQVDQTVGFSSYEPQQDGQAVEYNSYEPQQAEQAVDYSSYVPQQGDQAVDYLSYVPQQDEQAVEYNSYEPQQAEQAADYSSYAPQEGDQAVDYSSYAPQEGEQTYDYSPYAPQEGGQATDYSSYASQEQTTTYGAQEQVTASYEPPTTNSYEPQAKEIVSAYAPQYQASAQPSAPPVTDYISYAPQEISQQVVPPPQSAPPKQSGPPQRSMSAQQSAPPKQTAPPPLQQATTYAPYTPQQPDQSSMNNYTTPPVSEPPKKQQPAMVTPPRNMVSPPPAMFGYQQRSNSITEPDRRQSPSPFGYYNQFGLERASTVPPPMSERTGSPRPQLIACPDPQCEGENKAKAKFCCECGRPLAGISRSTTPSVTLSPGFTSHDTFGPSSFGAVAQRSLLDEKKDSMISSLKTFLAASPLKHADKQLALNYIDSRIGEFDENKALLWNIVKAMIQHQDANLGDGGELDKSILALLAPYADESSIGLDRLEYLLLTGDREAATQFAIENDMWGHAMILSQSNSAEHFKRVISQFIDRELFASISELKPQIPNDKKSLRMLYSIFSGTGADAVLELARESPQDYPSQCSVDHLQHEWKKALSLVIANRSSKDTEAINGLGNQLLQSGFTQYAQICFILSPDTGLESQILGATDMYTDLDILYLMELYEFATKSKYDIYKFIQAWWLTEFGLTDESKIYLDSIVSTQELNSLGDICNTTTTTNATSESVTSLLQKSTFDSLIGSISTTNNNQGSYDNTETSDNTYNYGYGYGGGYTAPGDQEVVQPKGIQSPFGVSASVPQTSPFQTKVSSPFGGTYGGAYAQPSNESSGWWGSEGQTTTTEPEQPGQPNVETSYQPDAYTPAPATSSYNNNDDDDDLGFGNSKKKPAKEESETKETVVTREEKPNEITSEDKKETEKGGWGIFSLFSRKEKEQNSDEKKAVKANLGEQSSFYYDEKEKRWVNKLNDSKPAAAATPPPPKAATPNLSSQAPPSMSNTPPVSSAMGGPPVMGGPPAAGLKPNSAPMTRISSTPNVLGPTSGGPPNAATPSFNTPPASRRAGGSKKKPMRSRYVDVLNTPQ